MESLTRRASAGTRLAGIGVTFVLLSLGLLAWGWAHGRFDGVAAGGLTAGLLALAGGLWLLRKERTAG
jgi:hypothetical protein